jgi:hypothetical protein
MFWHKLFLIDFYFLFWVMLVKFCALIAKLILRVALNWQAKITDWKAMQWADSSKFIHISQLILASLASKTLLNFTYIFYLVKREFQRLIMFKASRLMVYVFGLQTEIAWAYRLIRHHIAFTLIFKR